MERAYNARCYFDGVGSARWCMDVCEDENPPERAGVKVTLEIPTHVYEWAVLLSKQNNAQISDMLAGIIMAKFEGAQPEKPKSEAPKKAASSKLNDDKKFQEQVRQTQLRRDLRDLDAWGKIIDRE
ncbi:MAG: hypothetical protein K8T89_24020 [Planctomycetes bacterium]|nr:hypothetical protein [Planctomycetota bacterium]